MTPTELKTLLNIEDQLIKPDRPNRPGVVINPTSITIHNTSNTDAGAYAQAHSNFVRNVGHYVKNDVKNWVSWHFTVDDKTVIRQLPENEKAFHAGEEANLQSIAIEICMHQGIDQELANEKAACLCALLCIGYNIQPAQIVTHQHWTGKKCPVLLLDSWDDFIARVQYCFDEATQKDSSLAMSSLATMMDIAENLCQANTDGQWENLATLANEKLKGIGFDPNFLSTDNKAHQVAYPAFSESVPSSLRSSHTLRHYFHLSSFFNFRRKLALYSAVNYDKARYKTPKREDNFRLDPKLDKSLQLGSGFYKSFTIDKARDDNSNVFDRGHVIGRRYPQWGRDDKEAYRGQQETFYFTNIAPQYEKLNKEEWEDLENYIIEKGQFENERVSIFAGNFLNDSDPFATYIDHDTKRPETLQIPLKLWKVVYYVHQGKLHKIGFVMSQEEAVRKMPFVETADAAAKEAQAAGQPDRFRGFKPFIVNTSTIEKNTHLKFSDAEEKFHQSDRPLVVNMTDRQGGAKTDAAPMAEGSQYLSLYI